MPFFFFFVSSRPAGVWYIKGEKVLGWVFLSEEKRVLASLVRTPFGQQRAQEPMRLQKRLRYPISKIS